MNELIMDATLTQLRADLKAVQKLVDKSELDESSLTYYLGLYATCESIKSEIKLLKGEDL